MVPESSEKVVALYGYLRELCGLRFKSVRDISNQEWVLPLDAIPVSNEGVSISYRDSLAEEVSYDDAPILEVRKPEFKSCPDPGEELTGWLKPGWDYFRNEPSVYSEREFVDEQEESVYVEAFSDDSYRVDLYEKWLKTRAAWALKQFRINETRQLFVDLYKVHVDLERDPETLELMLGVGNLKDRSDQSIDHPMLLKRARTSFDSLTNTIRVEDSEDSSELYSLLLREMEGLSLDLVQKMELELARKDYHPFDRTGTPDYLKAFVHTLTPKSEFVDGEKDVSTARDVRLVMYMRPVIFVRKRIDGTVKAIDRIIECIEEDGGDIPAYLCDIVEGGVIDVEVDDSEPGVEEKLAAVGGEDVDILLTKEANREQLDIARRIEQYNAVLVQGPPGTGKTHTIANLMGHFLAQGKSVLVTSQTRKALSVLKEKVPEGLQSLCVSVLDDTNADMERSVDGITSYISRHSSSELRRDAAIAAQEREVVIAQLARTRREIFDALHVEHETIVLWGEGISPVEAATFVKDNAAALGGIIPGKVVVGRALPLTREELQSLYASNVAIDAEAEDEIELGVPDPRSLIEPAEFGSLTKLLSESVGIISEICQRRGWKTSGDMEPGSYLVAIGAERSLRIRPTNAGAISALREYARSRGGVERWRVKAMADGKKGGSYSKRWEMMFGQIEATCRISEKLVLESFGKSVAIDGSLDRVAAVSDLAKMGRTFEQKGKLGRVDMLMNRGFADVLENTSVNGVPVSSAEDCALVAAQINLQEEREKCRTAWKQLMSDNGAPEFDDLGTSDPERMALKWVDQARELLAWYSIEREKYGELVSAAGMVLEELLVDDPLETEESNAEWALEAMRHVVPDLCNMSEALLNITHATASLADTMRVLREGDRSESRTCQALVQAVAAKDPDAYERSYVQLRILYSKQKPREVRQTLINRLYDVAPDWAVAVEGRDGIHGMGTPPDRIQDAWKWKQLLAILEEIASVSLSELQQRAYSLSREYRRTTVNLAEKRAWLALLERTEHDITLKQALEGWKQTVKKIGKGTGKRAPMMKARARELMSQCQSAVPAWIMPMGRALESLDPKSNRFDVVIVDEASQSDVSALAITYFARKVIIVGDDKQVSPMAVGIEEGKAAALADMYIKGRIPNYHLYGLKTSLYDIAKTTFHPLMLQEHFRCMPEIIGFSNMLSYDFKIKPLRDPGSSDILPSIVTHRVMEGERVGKGNRREAEEIVKLILACMKQPEYEGKTFGVISLLGDEQVKLIQSLMFEKLEMSDIEERRILCGNASDFQGDERDVIFLSMVDSNIGEGPLRLTGYGADDSIRKRYNVAASRAKDQLWVVHSLDSSNDLKGDDLRKRLIDYANDPEAFSGRIKEVEDLSESPFESAVGKSLVAKGYRIAQQWPVGAYRIDIVAMDGNKRVAVECDGERWHSGEKKIREDMERQAVLERLGWRFVRVRGSEYYRDPDAAMGRVVSELTSYGIAPAGPETQCAGGGRTSELLDRVRACANELAGFSEGEKLSVKERDFAIEEALGSAIQVKADDEGNSERLQGESFVSQPRFGLLSLDDVAITEAVIAGSRPEDETRASQTDGAIEGSAHAGKPSAGKAAPRSAEVQAKREAEKRTRDGGLRDSVGDPGSRADSKAQRAVVASKPKSDDPVIADLAERGLECVDKRAKGGALWVVGGRDVDFAVKDVGKKYGVRFEFAAKGGKATKSRPGYYMTGKPALPAEGRGRETKAGSVKMTKKEAAARYRVEYVTADLPFTPLPDAEDYDRSAYRGAVEKRMRILIEVESPIEKQRLFSAVRQSFGVKRSGSYIQAHNERVLKSIGCTTTSFNGSYFIWKPGAEPNELLTYRPNGDKVTRSVKELPFEEIAAAFTEVLVRRGSASEDDLIEKTAKRLGFKRVAKRISEVLGKAIDEGVRRRRFVRGKGGMISLR